MAHRTSTVRQEPADARFAAGFDRMELVLLAVALDDRARCLLRGDQFADARRLDSAGVLATVADLHRLRREACAVIDTLPLR